MDKINEFKFVYSWQYNYKKRIILSDLLNMEVITFLMKYIYFVDKEKIGKNFKCFQ